MNDMERSPSTSSAGQHPVKTRQVLVYVTWFLALALVVGVLLCSAAILSYPRPGASDALEGSARFQEALGNLILHIANAPFSWIGHSMSVGAREVIIWIVWTVVLYGLSVWSQRPRRVFRLASSPP